MSRLKALNRRVFDMRPISPIGRWIYERRRLTSTPQQSTATRFFRNVEQLRAFDGPLAQFLKESPLRILVAGCSMGCEAYSIAAFLAMRRPLLDFHIVARDISSEALETAQKGVFGTEHGLGQTQDPEIITLERHCVRQCGDRYVVTEEIRRRLSFVYGNVLDESFADGRAFDCVFGQNFMIHMSDKNASLAFETLIDVTRPGGAIFVGGIDLSLREMLITKHKLMPVDWNVAAIHDCDDMRRSAWPWYYWSLEPINPLHRSIASRYGTIFRRPSNIT